MRGLDGKTAIVAGGSTLIGQGVAETLDELRLQRRHCRYQRGRRRGRGQKVRQQGPFHPLRSHQRRGHRRPGQGNRRGDRQARLPRQRRLHLPRQWRRNDARRLAQGLRRQHRRLGHADAGGTAASEKEQGRHRQLRVDLLARRADRPLGLSGVEGRHPAIDAQPGDGPRAGRHSRQRRLAGLDLEQHHGRIDQGQPRQRPTALPSLSICSAAPAIPPKSRKRWRSCFPTMRASSPAPTSGSTAVTPPWAPNARTRRFLC